MILTDLDGKYLKFYFTDNPNLPILLKNTGYAIILAQTSNISSALGDNNSNDPNTLSLQQQYKNSHGNTDNVETTLYSLWIGGEKIFSGHGLFNGSIDDVNQIIKDIKDRLDLTISKDESYNHFLLKDGLTNNKGSFENSNNINFNNAINPDQFDERADLSNTFFVDGNLNDGYNTCVKMSEMYNYIANVVDQLNVKSIEFNNITYNLTYVDNKYSIKQHLIQYNAHYDQQEVFINVPKHSILKKLNISFYIDNLNEQTQYAIMTSISGITNMTYNAAVPHEIGETRVWVNAEVSLENNDIYPAVLSNIQYIIDITNDTSGTQDTYVLPAIKFMTYDNNIGYVVKTTSASNYVPNAMYNIGDNVLIYDYDLSQETNNDRFNLNDYDRLYILVNSKYQINEVYIKCFYKSKHSDIINYTNITDNVYRYKQTFTYNNVLYNVFGFNVNQLFSRMVSANDSISIDRMIIKCMLDINDIPKSTEIIEFNNDSWYYNNQLYNYNSSNGWTIGEDGRYYSNNITYIQSTEYETTNWSEETFDINVTQSKVFNYIY